MDTTSPKLHIEECIPLAPYTTLGIGGPARYFARAKNEEHISEGLHFARRCACPVFILGGGSNLVVSDSGFPGLVLKIEIKGIDGLSGRNDGIVSAAAGEDWDSFVQHCTDRSLAGIECLSGIPGTVGATPVQNVGAYGQESSETIRSVRVLDRESLSLRDLINSQCGFEYRTSIFNSTAKERFVITRVDFSLHPGGDPRIEYQDLKRHFSACGSTPSIREVREAVLEIRRSKGMTLDQHDVDSKSAGSFFKNPIITSVKAAGLEQKARACGILAASEHIPRFKTASGEEKLPAAWLIEHAGFNKGLSSGRAGISTKHCLALVNRGGASAQDIMDLMRRIQDRVRTLFEIELHSEPIFVGFDRK
jgi:UDP-N-acetylmuramate dehydrogenase